MKSLYIVSLLISLVNAQNGIILAPSQNNEDLSKSETSVASPVPSSMATKDNLKILNDVICEVDPSTHKVISGSCYSLHFEPSLDWQVIKPKQMLPGGLDIRINLETGLKEAKLIDGTTNQDSNDLTNSNNQDNELINTPDKSIDYEFSNNFNQIKQLIDSGFYEKSMDQLDDILDYSHDFKHGFKIITNEFTNLRDWLLNKQYPLSLRDLVARIFIGSVRNNPPVVEFIQTHHSDFIQEIFNSLDSIEPILTKRYLSMLIELIDSQFVFHYQQLDKLDKIYQSIDSNKDNENEDLKLKILQIVSVRFNQINDDPNFNPRNRSLQTWLDRLVNLIIHDKDRSIDEWHIRHIFNSIYNLKMKMGTQLKIDQKFIYWLDKQAKDRKLQLENGLQERDLEQDSFDQKLIDSRHAVFGNPMAQRLHDEF